MFLTVDAHFENAGQLSEKSRKLFFGDKSCALRIQGSPGLFKPSDFLASNFAQAAWALINITEALVDERDEQTGEDVHA